MEENRNRNATAHTHHYQQLRRFIRNCHWLKKPSHDLPLIFLLLLRLRRLFGEWARSHTTIRSTSSSECASAQPSTQAPQYFHHRPKPPECVCECARCVCVSANDRRCDTHWMCRKIHIHTLMRRLANVQPTAANSGNGQWDQQAAPIPMLQQQ